MAKLLLLVVLFAVGCGEQVETENAVHVSCSAEWYSHAERILSIADDQGHGPDLGSAEWRSAAEFKLNIRSAKDKPELMSEQWCGYVDIRLH